MNRPFVDALPIISIMYKFKLYSFLFRKESSVEFSPFVRFCTYSVKTDN